MFIPPPLVFFSGVLFTFCTIIAYRVFKINSKLNDVLKSNDISNNLSSIRYQEIYDKSESANFALDKIEGRMNSDEYVGLAELKKQQKNLQQKVNDDLSSVVKNQAKFFDEQQNIRNSISQNKALINNLGSSQNY
jgi:hypothetical protein|tara:strand:+ start:244 stop:648 length:405 start_codon:yes stop_codon:yes gene_type:complete